MSQISDEIVDLIVKNRLDELKKIKNHMSEKDYVQSEYNIISSRDNDSLELEELLNQIKDRELLSIVISNLKKNIEIGQTYTDATGKLNIAAITRSVTEVQANYKKINSEKENIKDVATTILSVAVIDHMIKNYNQLSNEEVGKLISSYHNMSTEQQKSFNHAQANSIRELAQSIDDQEIKENLEKQADITENLVENRIKKQQYFNEHPEKQQNIIKELFGDLEKHNSLLKEFIEKGIDIGGKIPDIKEIFPEGIISIDNWIEKDPQVCYTSLLNLSDEYTHFSERFLQELKLQFENGKLSINERNAYLRSLTSSAIELNIDKSRESIKDDAELPKYVYKQKKLTHKLESDDSISNIVHIPKESIKSENSISREMEQIPSALAKVGYMPEQIKDSLKKYIDTFKNLDDDDVSEIAFSGDEDMRDALKEIFIENEMNEEIANILSTITYNGKLKEILTNQQTREMFLKQFDKILEQEISATPNIKINGELEQVFSKYFEQNAVEMDVEEKEREDYFTEQISIKQITIESQQEQDEQKTEGSNVQPEIYSFIDTNYLEQDSKEGLLPRNGENSQTIQDDKKAIFYSQGKEGAIVMYFEFLKQYENLRGARGDAALQQYMDHQNGTVTLTKNEEEKLVSQLKQIQKVRNSESFEQYMGDKLYLKLNGIDIKTDKDQADVWRQAHSSKMNYNYANSWTTNEIPPDNLEVMTLQGADTSDVRTSQKDIITYFLSQTNIEAIKKLGVNDTTLKIIEKFYKDHTEEITKFGEEYSLVPRNMQEFSKEQSKITEISDTTQGSNSSAKIKPNQIITGLLNNVKTSDVQEAQKSVNEIYEKGDKALEEDKETLEV